MDDRCPPLFSDLMSRMAHLSSERELNDVLQFPHAGATISTRRFRRFRQTMRSLLWIVCALVSIDARNAPMSKSWGWEGWEEESEEKISVCYPNVGCFDNQPPFDNANGLVPQEPAFIDTHFLLFTKTNPLQPELLHYENADQAISKSQFNSSRWVENHRARLHQHSTQFVDSTHDRRVAQAERCE